jgi:hypothetical protein
MPCYICDRCNYATSKKCDFKRHCARKVVCCSTNNNITQQELYDKYFSTEGKIKCDAPNCSKYLNTKDGKHKHQKKCPHMVAYLIQLKEEEDKEAAINEEVNRRFKAVEFESEIKKRFELMLSEKSIAINAQSQTAEVINNNSTTDNTNNSTTNNIDNSTHVTININPFGGEWKEGTMQHIVSNRAFMLKCLRNNGPGICELLRMMHFDSEHPENRNVRKLLKKDTCIEYYDGTRWVADTANNVIQKISNGMECILIAFLDERQVNEKLLKRFSRNICNPMGWDMTIADNCPDMKEDTRPEHIMDQIKKDTFGLLVRTIYEESKAGKAGV